MMINQKWAVWQSNRSYRKSRSRPGGRKRRFLTLELLENRELLAVGGGDLLYVADGVNNSIVKFRADNGELEASENNTQPARVEYLYVSDLGQLDDPSDDRVVEVNLATGEATKSFSLPGRMIGPRGVIMENPSTLLVINQNVGQPIPGEVLRFDVATGAFLNAIVPSTTSGAVPNSAAPFAPRGIVVRDYIIYVADFAEGDASGRIAMYDLSTGKLLGDLRPSGFGGEFRPRGLVFGPDAQLYVTTFGLDAAGNFNPDVGYVLRMNPKTGVATVIAANDGDGINEAGELTELHRPEGLAFDPLTGLLYVTSYRSGPQGTDKILAIDPVTRTLVSSIVLAGPEGSSAYAEAIVFGPDGLYVPITGDGPDRGSVRRYNVSTNSYTVVVPAALAGGPLLSPWYLTFGNMRQDTLLYDPPTPWHNSVNPLDVNGRGGVTPLDVLQIINYLNLHGNQLPASPAKGPPYYEVTPASGQVVPAHALQIINYLNSQSLIRPAEAEGEGSERTKTSRTSSLAGDLPSYFGRTQPEQRSLAETRPPVRPVMNQLLNLDTGSSEARAHFHRFGGPGLSEPVLPELLKECIDDLVELLAGEPTSA